MDTTQKFTQFLESLRDKIGDTFLITQSDRRKLKHLLHQVYPELDITPREKQVDEQATFLEIVRQSFIIYEHTGANSRSNEKVKYLHDSIMELMKSELKKMSLDATYHIKTEQNVPSINDAGKKKCDIVIYLGSRPIVIFPVKFIMSNYNQNKNNYFENLTGELCHLKWANPEIKICPINIIPSILPYKKTGGIITKFEKVRNQLDIYEELVQRGLCTQSINYIIDCEYQCQIGDKYQVPKIIGISEYRSICTIFKLLDL